MTLANLIIEKLKQSSLYNGDEENPNIILFSDEDVFPKPPYIIVKPENGAIENTRGYRIIVHMEKEFLDELENFVLVELDNLLLGDYLNDEEGGRYKLRPAGYTDVLPEKLDGTYYAERLYYVPLAIRR